MKDLCSMLNNAVREGSACIRPPVFTVDQAPWIHNLVKPPTVPKTNVAPYENTTEEMQTSRDGQPSSTYPERRPARGSRSASYSSGFGATPVVLRSRSRQRSRSPRSPGPHRGAMTGNRPDTQRPDRRSPIRRPPTPTQRPRTIAPTRGQPIYLTATEGYWEAEWDRCFPGLRRGECYYCFGNHRSMDCPNLATYTCSWCQSNIHWKPNCKKYKRVRNYRADNPR